MRDIVKDTYFGQEETAAERRGRRRRKERGRAALVMMGCLVAMVAVIYFTVTVCVWIDEQVKANAVVGAQNSVGGEPGGNMGEDGLAEGNPGSGDGENGLAEGNPGSGDGEDGLAGGIPGSGDGEDGLAGGTSGSGDGEDGSAGDHSGGNAGEDTVPGGKDDDVVSAISNGVVYSQEELDKQVASAREQAVEDVLGSIRAGLSEGDTVLETLRPLFPEELVVYSSGKYHFVPIDRQLKQNSWDEECLDILESGEYRYLQDGEVISYKGIDVSRHQGKIDWKQVAEDGVKFAFIRVGYRGYGTGKLVGDDYFEENIKGAIAAGIKVGVYFYSQAINEEEVLEEANFVLEKIAPYQIDCPVAFDVEKVTGASGRMNEISVEERTDLTLLFCQEIENAGYRPIIYYNTEMGALMLDLARVEDREKWFAAYSDEFYYPYAYKVWQYSQTGSVKGISGDVDLNISFVPLWEE